MMQRGVCRTRGLRVRPVVVVALIVMVAAIPFGARGATAAPSTTAGVSAPGVLVPIVASGHAATHHNVGASRPGAGSHAHATALSTFHVNYSGFTPAAHAAFQAAVDYWAATVASTVPITINATFSDLGTNSADLLILGQAGPTGFYRDFNHAPVARTFYPVALANRFAAKDLDPADPDIEAGFTSNAGASWYFGTDGLTPPGDLDFESVVKHEIGHGLGFLGSMGVDSDGVGSWGIGGGYPAIYDRFTTDSVGTPLLSYANNSTALGNALVSDGIYFHGPATPNAKLYAPSTFIGGSTYSHLDEATYPEGDPNELMTPSIDYGESVAAAGPLALDMFQDMGWFNPLPRADHDLTGDANPDLLVRTAAGLLYIYPGNGTGGVRAPIALGGGYAHFNKLIVTPDLKSGRIADFVGRDGKTGTLSVYAGAGGGAFTPKVGVGGVWKSFTALVAPGDFNGDGKPDLIARTANGRLMLYRGNGLNGFVLPAVQIAAGWKAFTAVVAPGDFNGDGKPDLIARTGNGHLLLYRGNGLNGFKGPAVQIATGWKAFTAVVAPGDFNGDGKPDLIARTANGRLMLYRGNGLNGFKGPAVQIATGWNRFNSIS